MGRVGTSSYRGQPVAQCRECKQGNLPVGLQGKVQLRCRVWQKEVTKDRPEKDLEFFNRRGENNQIYILEK